MYVKRRGKNVETCLENQCMELMKGASTLLLTEYIYDIDVSPELYTANATYHQSLIGVLIWFVETFRVVIFCKV